MGASCIFADDDHVELLEGLIVPKMIRKPVHDAVVEIVREAISRVLPGGLCIRGQSAITTSDSEPEPDIVVVHGTARDYLGHHPGPTEIELVVEVAETSLDRDRNKRRLYARAGIACYWIINIQGREVEVYTKATSEEEPKYEVEIVYGTTSSIPFVIAGQRIAEIPASDLLP
jgi:Uma2 family endonuclease